MPGGEGTRRGTVPAGQRPVHGERGKLVVAINPALPDDLFTHVVDEHEVQFVRPADMDGPVWGAYDGARFLVMVHAEVHDDATE